MHKRRRRRRLYLDGPLGRQNRDAQLHLGRLPGGRRFKEKRKCPQELSLMGTVLSMRDQIVQRPGDRTSCRKKESCSLEENNIRR